MSVLQVGDVLEDRYRIDQPIARGGMATVYRCVDLRLGRAVAVKVMLDRYADDPVFKHRFNREARAMAMLSHPNLVGVYDVGSTGTTDFGEQVPAFLIMELITGGTLREFLAERGPMPPHAAVAVMRQLLTGLSAAHDTGMIHRDLKPDNILISGDHTVKIADFGLARGVDTQQVQSRDIVGTPAYLSPEQVRGDTLTPASDVYSAGIVFFELLTGERPLHGDTPLEHAYQRLKTDIDAPSSRIDGIPSLVDALVAGATARPVEERFPDAGAFLAAVDDVAKELQMPDFTVPVPTQSAAHRTSEIPTDVSDLPAALEPTGIVSDAKQGTDTGLLPSPKTEGLFPEHDGFTAFAPVPAGAIGPGGVGAAGPSTSILPPDNFDHPPQQVRPVQQRNPASQAKTSPPVRNTSVVKLIVWITVIAVLFVSVAVGGWWLGSGRYGEIPQVGGMQQVAAVAAVEEAGFQGHVQEIYSDDVAEGISTGTDPDPSQGDRAVRGSEISILVSQGQPSVPEIPGNHNPEVYRAALKERTLTPVIGEEVYSDDVPAGALAIVDPGAGTRLATGSTVTLHLSKGAAPVNMPDITGLSQVDATDLLQRSGLKLGSVRKEFDASISGGDVISAHPEAGAEIPRGTPVDLVISTAVELPDVTGDSLDEATVTLRTAGLSVSSVKRDRSTTGDAADEVINVEAAGESRPEKSDEPVRVDPHGPGVIITLPGKAHAPTLLGKSVAEAREITQQRGLSFNSDDGDDERIYHQSPLPRASMDLDDAVTVRAL